MKVITELPRIVGPSIDEFMNEYVLKKRPVIITGGLDSWNAKNWNLDILKEKIGNKEFSFRTETGRRKAHFDEMIDQIQNSHNERPAPYLRNIDLLETFPELKDDVFPIIPYMQNNWRNHWAWPKKWPIHVQKNQLELFISARSVALPMLHLDYWGMNAFIAQIYGSKEFILFNPEDSAYLYPSKEDPLVSMITDINNPDFEKFPEFAKATQYRIHLKAGDLLYNPNWWHTTMTLESSITIIMAYWNRSNYLDFVDEVQRIYKDCNKIKTFAMVQYFKAIGLLF
jgi:hypothetical protein